MSKKKKNKRRGRDPPGNFLDRLKSFRVASMGVDMAPSAKRERERENEKAGSIRDRRAIEN